MAEYYQTDLIVLSKVPNEEFHLAMSRYCEVHSSDPYDNDGWQYTFATTVVWSPDRNAEADIASLLDCIDRLPPSARLFWEQCISREFNMGFNCYRTCERPFTLSAELIQRIAIHKCRVAIFLYQHGPEFGPLPPDEPEEQS